MAEENTAEKNGMAEGKEAMKEPAEVSRETPAVAPEKQEERQEETESGPDAEKKAEKGKRSERKKEPKAESRKTAEKETPGPAKDGKGLEKAKKGFPVLYVVIFAAALVAVLAILMVFPLNVGASVEKGDMVIILYNVTQADGTPVDSGNFTFLVGSQSAIKGVDEAVMGMKVNEQKKFTVLPEKAYGNKSNELMIPWPLVSEDSAVFNLTMYDFNDTFNTEPAVNHTYMVPYYNWAATITGIEDGVVWMRHNPGQNKSYNLTYGQLILESTYDKVIIRIVPAVGSQYTRVVGAYGYPVIDSYNETDMVLDYNHPLAGKTLVFDVRLLGFRKANS